MLHVFYLVACSLIGTAFGVLCGIAFTGCNHHDRGKAYVPVGGLGNGTIRQVWLPASWSPAHQQNQLASIGSSYAALLNTQGQWFWSFNGRLYSWGTKVYAPGQSPFGWSLWVSEDEWLFNKFMARAGFGFVDRKDKRIVVASHDCVAPWTLRMLVQAWVDPDVYYQDSTVWDRLLGRGAWAGLGIEEALILNLKQWWSPCPP